jgi:uncharacterized protein
MERERSAADSPVFIDTGYLVALINRKDGLHAQAKALARKWLKGRRRAVTTDAVLIEFANFFATSPLRMAALSAIRRIRSGSGWTIERVTSNLLDRAEARYGAHPDKGWSLTDCLSMEVMLDHATTDAATPDRHFAQARFRVLMRTSRE